MVEQEKLCRMHGERLAAIETSMATIQESLKEHSAAIKRSDKFWFAALAVVVVVTSLDKIKTFIGSL